MKSLSPLVVIALLLAAASAEAANGRVTYVTSGEVFLDAGVADGLAMGAKIDITRRKRKVSTCEVVEAAAHHAVCKNDRAEPGDRFSFTPSPTDAKGPAQAAARKKPLPGAAELDARRQAVLQAPLEKVVYKKARRSGAPVWSARATATLRQQVWTTTRGDTFARPSLDASARTGIGLFRGLYASGALRLVGDVVAPENQRFRADDPLELYVWDVEIGVSDGPIVGALGRFRPRKAPGMVLLDGAQAGLSAFGGSLEVGAYAGAIPDVLTLAPSLDRLTAGAYFGLDLEASDGLLFLPRARVGLVTTPDLGTLRAEAEAQTQVLWRDVGSIGGSARVGTGGNDNPLPTLDAARGDLDLYPWSPLRLHGGWRYLAPLAVDFDALNTVGRGVSPVGGAHHGDLSAALTATPWLTLGGITGVGYDVVTENVRGYAGPEIGLPNAFGSIGGLTLGWLEELGFMGGRTAWVQTTFTPFQVLRVMTRASYFETAPEKADLGDAMREAALLAWVDAPILPWLSLRGRAHAQGALPALDGQARETLGLLMVDLGVSGSL